MQVKTSTKNGGGGMNGRLVVLTRNKTGLVLSTFMALLAVSLGQTNPQNVPQPPSVELQKFEPFLGNYEVSGDYTNLPWAGTLELKKVIKGWYIEQIIRIKSPGILGSGHLGQECSEVSIMGISDASQSDRRKRALRK